MKQKNSTQQQKPLIVGINHVALEVGNINDALEFYQKIFNFTLRGKSKSMAFIDMGDQFLALFENRKEFKRDEGRHFGLVVDDRTHVRELAKAAGAELIESERVEFYDPWGNYIQVVEYKDIQFTKTDEVQKGMGIHLTKTKEVLAELEKKGIKKHSF